MLAQRSLIRPDQMDQEGAYRFAQLVLDGYSGGDTNDGYLMGLVLTDGYTGGTDSIHFDAHTGAINQIKNGQVTFNGNVDAKNGLDVTGADLNVALNAVIQGNLTVNGLTTTINTQQMTVTDPITTINAFGGEIASKWAGLSARDVDGYNRMGWVFTGATGGPTDGYWALSPVFNGTVDATPTRAIAYTGAGDGYADISSTSAANSGASMIGFYPVAPFEPTSVTVQLALEELHAEIANATSYTDNSTFTVNHSATAGTPSTGCYIAEAASATAHLDGYLCSIADDTNGDRFQFTQFRDGTLESPRVNVGSFGGTQDLDAYLVLNGGTGSGTSSASLKLDGTLDKLVYTAGSHEFVNNVTMDNGLTVSGNTNFNGSSNTIGNATTDTLTVTATITSDLLPTDLTYLLGNASHRWLDAYVGFPTPVNYTPVGDPYSLIGQLKGIDAAMANVVTAPPKGVYKVTTGEGTTDSIDTSRAVDSGVAINVSSLTDAQFRDYIYVYWNGQFLWNDSSSAIDNASVVRDVARKTGDLKTILFASNLNKNSVIQIIDMR